MKGFFASNDFFRESAVTRATCQRVYGVQSSSAFTPPVFTNPGTGRPQDFEISGC